MNDVAAIIASEIAILGPIPFARFMELALYEPVLGYYASGKSRVGKSGDFFTSVSVGSALGAVLARQFEEMWDTLGRPEGFTIVEQGANDGVLARDILTSARPEFLDGLRYHIIEPVHTLREIQRATLPGLPVQWSDSAESLPGFTGVHFSNELIDSLPFHLLESDGTGWNELHVTGTHQGFSFTTGPLSPQAQGDPLPQRPAGYIAEIRPAAGLWIQGIASRLQRGYVLVVDYGFPREVLLDPARTRGTFASFHHHRRDENVLDSPGRRDLTAHVDFTALSRAAEQCGLHQAGFCDQYHFLVGAGESLIREHEGRASDPFLRSLMSLLHPASMGSQFHAMCFQTPDLPPTRLSGFQKSSQS